MKLIFLLVIVPISVFSFGGNFDFSAATYTVVNDRYDSEIETGHFILRGIINSGDGTDPIIGATVTNADQSKGTVTDVNGLFNFKFHLKDSLIYCYGAGFSEVVVHEKFQNKHVITVKVQLSEQVRVCYKPVIYAYNASDSLTIQLLPKGNFTFTYPKSQDGKWTIKTNSDGTITNLADTKNYPYIFWEGENSNLKIIENDAIISGYLIKTDTCIAFLESTLSKYGLNAKESTDFITFWGPKISDKPFALIQFLNTESYESTIANLTIEPKPQTLLRLYMYLVPLDSETILQKVEAPKILSRSRKGLTVVEWGGSILNQNGLIN